MPARAILIVFLENAGVSHVPKTQYFGVGKRKLVDMPSDN
jgi:hypothetical protein